MGCDSPLLLGAHRNGAPLPRDLPQAGAEPPQQRPPSNPKHLSHPVSTLPSSPEREFGFVPTAPSLVVCVTSPACLIHGAGRKQAVGLGGDAAVPQSMGSRLSSPQNSGGVELSPPFAPTPCARRRGPRAVSTARVCFDRAITHPSTFCSG